MIRTGPVEGLTFARAVAMVRGRAWLTTLEHDMTAKTGRPRVHSWEALCVVLQIAAIEGFDTLLLTDAARVAERLTETQKRDIGIACPMEYSHLESAVADVATALHEGVDLTTGEVLPPRLSLTLPDLMTGVSAAFIPGSIPATATQSIDSTDYETHYRRRSWRHHMTPDVPADALPEDFTPTKAEVNEPGCGIARRGLLS